MYKGFAFVNCLNPRMASKLFEILEERTWLLVLGSQKRVLRAHVQGLAHNIAHYIGSSVIEAGSEHVPIVMDGETRVSFDEAVRRYVPPELVTKRRQEVREAPLKKLEDETVKMCCHDKGGREKACPKGKMTQAGSLGSHYRS